MAPLDGVSDSSDPANAAADQSGLGGLSSLIDNAHRVVICDSANNAGAAAQLLPKNPVVWYDPDTPTPSLAPLSGRDAILWADLPAYELLPWGLIAQLRSTCLSVSVFLPGDPMQALSPAEVLANKPPQFVAWFKANLHDSARITPPVVHQDQRQAVQIDAQPIETPPPLPPYGQSSQSDPVPTLLAEDTLAREFSRQHPQLRYVHAWGRWLEWDGKRWLIDETLKAYDYARDICVTAADEATYHADVKPSEIKRAKSAQVRAAVENLARSDRRHAATTAQWDADPWALSTPTGIVDLRTGRCRASTMEDYATKQTAVGPGGQCPLWRQFLDVATAGDKDLQAYLQRAAGYLLTGDTREQCFLFVYGPGGNGKGTFINTLTRILGDYALVAGMEVFTETKSDRHTTELARLRGARMVSAQETEDGKRWAESRIKAITGGDPITARFMRQDDFTFTPQFKLLLAGNHRPSLRNIDEAMKRRLHLVPFTVQIPPERRDNALPEKLQAEYSGILQWAIEGCVAWQAQGLRPPLAVQAATAEYFEAQDTISQWMEDCCVIDPKYRGGVKACYRSYAEWVDAAGEHPISLKRWKDRMLDRGHPEKRFLNGNFLLGFNIRSEIEGQRAIAAVREFSRTDSSK